MNLRIFVKKRGRCLGVMKLKMGMNGQDTPAIVRVKARVRRWNKTGYYSCNRCGWDGDRPKSHDRRCPINAVWIEPIIKLLNEEIDE